MVERECLFRNWLHIFRFVSSSSGRLGECSFLYKCDVTAQFNSLICVSSVSRFYGNSAVLSFNYFQFIRVGGSNPYLLQSVRVKFPLKQCEISFFFKIRQDPNDQYVSLKGSLDSNENKINLYYKYNQSN